MPVVPLGPDTTVTTPSTAEDVITQTQRLLASGQREQQNKLATTATANTTSLSFTYDLKGITEGTHLSVDLEDYYVWSIDAGAKTATVESGYNGSVSVLHAANTIVQVNPRFSKFNIFSAINDEIRGMTGEGLYRMNVVDVTWSANVQGYDLDGVDDILGTPYKVLRKQTGTNKYWPEIRSYRYDDNLPTADFASGKGIFIFEGAIPGETIRVYYKSGFSTLSSLTDNIVSVSGVPETAVDILWIGAAARLVEPREVRRADLNSQGDSRRAEEVPAGSLQRAAAGLWGQRQRRINAEKERLTRLYPPRLNG